MRLKEVAIVLLLVAGGAVLASLGVLKPAASNATTLLTTPASVQDVTDEIAATGTIQAVAKYFLAFGEDPVTVDGDAAEDGSQGGDATVASVEWPVATVTAKVGDRDEASTTAPKRQIQQTATAAPSPAPAPARRSRAPSSRSRTRRSPSTRPTARRSRSPAAGTPPTIANPMRAQATS